MLCQAAGATALPYPLVEELLAIDGARLALVNPEAPRVDHGDLAGDWIAADLDGARYHVQPSSRTAAKLGPFLVPATLSEPDGTVPAADVDLHLSVGIVADSRRGAAGVGDHPPARRRPDAVRQAARGIPGRPVHHRRRLRRRPRAFTNSPSIPSAEWNRLRAQVRSADALVLRLKATETARQVFRAAHQLLGALGFCDESDVSVLDRHTQPLIRLPVSTEVLATRLMPGVRGGGLETLFSGPVSA